MRRGSARSHRQAGSLVAGVLVAAAVLGGCGEVDMDSWGIDGPRQAPARAGFNPLPVGTHRAEPALNATDARSKEYKVKSAVLFNFLKYTKFPEGTYDKKDSPIKILVVGKNPFGPILERVLGKKKVRGRAIKIEYAKELPKGDLTAQLIFASGLSVESQKALIKKVDKQPILLVGEMDGFAERGAFVNLYLEKGKVRFSINTDCQKSTGIKLKAELLKLAKLVKTSKATMGGGQ